MAKPTHADAARQLGIARSTLYKLTEQSKISLWRPHAGRCARAPAPAALHAERVAGGLAPW